MEQPPGIINDENTDAKIIRHLAQALIGAPITSFAGGAGAVGMGHGICTSDDLKVTQMDTPGMGVKVAVGLALITGTVSAEQGPHSVYHEADEDVSLAASDPTNARDDLIIAQVRDDDYSGSERDCRLTVVTGTPASSPSDPSLADYPNALVLARVRVDAGATSITNAKITDLRPRARGSNWNVAWGEVAYAQITSNPSGVTSEADVSGLSVTWTAIAGRKYRTTFFCGRSSVDQNAQAVFRISDGSNTLKQQSIQNVSSGVIFETFLSFRETGLSGSVTRKIRASASAGTMTINAGSTFPVFILVEDIGPS